MVIKFDGSSTEKLAGAGVVITSPEGTKTALSFNLDFECTNNQAEYEACVFGLETLRSMGAEQITVYGDSMLVVKQVSKEWEVKEEKLKPYVNHLLTITLSFNQYKFEHLP